jgi:hypothetical protein
MRRGYRRVSRGSVFLLAMVALVALLFLGTSLVEVAIHGLSFASKQHKRAEALVLAESGVEMVLEKLYDGYDAHAPYGSPAEELEQTGSYTDDFSLGGGAVSVVATAPFGSVPRSCEIRSTGVTRTNQRETIRVIATYEDDKNRVFQGAIFCNSDLTLKGGGAVYPDASGIGGDIYAKGYINFDTQSAYHMSPSGSIYSATEQNIVGVPDEVLPSNVHVGISPLTMPVIDLDWYRKQVLEEGKGTYFSSPQHWTTQENDLSTYGSIIFVEGDVTVSGHYSGNVAIVATGFIKVTGNGFQAATESDSLALISPKGIQINGGGTVDGLIYSHGVEVKQTGGVGAGGSITVNGAIVADVVRTNGSITVKYDDVWMGLPIPGKGPTQLRQVSWEELLQ